MSIKRLIWRLLLFILLLVLGYAIYYAWRSFPIVSGYSAKNACSCAFIQGRDQTSINKEELGSFPLSLGSIQIDYKDSSVTGTVWGLATRKAIFRKGLGCTLVNDFPETELRKQSTRTPLSLSQSDTVAWPMGDRMNIRLSDSFPLLDSAVSFAFQHKFDDKDVNTRALLVVYKDQILAEKYAPGYNMDSKFLGWSMAKSVTAALIGILVNQGKLRTDAPAPVPEWSAPGDKRHDILLQHLLQQTSGLEFSENYNKFSSVTNMLFNKGDMAAYAAGLPLKYEPGSFFYYSSGNSNLLSRIVRSTVGESYYPSFPYEALFYKIGMFHTLLEPDASGTYVGSSYVYATARDYARFGLLYLNEGKWKGEQILPPGWVKQTRTSSTANALRNYGYQFWLNGFDPDNNSAREYPELPADMFYADGYGGQRIYIIPSIQMVVVRMGLNKFDEHGFLRLLMKGIRDQN